MAEAGGARQRLLRDARRTALRATTSTCPAAASQGCAGCVHSETWVYSLSYVSVDNRYWRVSGYIRRPRKAGVRAVVNLYLCCSPILCGFRIFAVNPKGGTNEQRAGGRTAGPLHRRRYYVWPVMCKNSIRWFSSVRYYFWVIREALHIVAMCVPLDEISSQDNYQLYRIRFQSARIVCSYYPFQPVRP